MRHFQKAGVALLAGLAGLVLSGVAAAANDTKSAPQAEPPQHPQGTQERQPGAGAVQGGQQGTAPEYAGPQEGKPKGFGAGIGGMTFILGPLEAGGTCPGSATSQGYGAGVGPSGETESATEQGRTGAAAAPVPQYWLADASLFVANAGNAAQALANEQSLGVQAPSVLGNQAQFLLAATDRAMSSLQALQANAEATNPHAVPDIKAAMDELNAAKGQAKQALEAATSGTFGPSHQANIRSTYEHLQAADRELAGVGRAYGTPGFTIAMTRGFVPTGRGMGVGIGGGGKAAPGTTKAPENKAPETKPPEPKPPEQGTPAPEKP
jgi:hypothetical protein